MGTKTAAEVSRVARLHVEKGKGRARSVVTASVPTNVTAKECGVLQTIIIDKIIKDLTGCACLSGAVDVIFRDEFEDVIRVDMRTGKSL